MMSVISVRNSSATRRSAFEKLREDDRYLELPVIVLTAMELSVEELQRLNAHVTEVLQKGATSTTNLVNLVRSVLGKG